MYLQTNKLLDKTMNIDELIKFHQDLLDQQRYHKDIQKETIKLVTMLNKNVIDFNQIKI